MKKGIALLLSVVMLAVMLPLGAITATAADGYCGDTITWSIEEDVLTLSGSGEMWHYDFRSNEVPWDGYQTIITKVVVEEGITTLGTNAFCDFTELTAVELPTTLKALYMNAFACCTKLEEFTIPVGLTTMDTSVFANCSRMQEYKVAEGNTHFSAVDGVLFNADRTVLWSYPIGQIREVYEMPDTVEAVEAYAFSEAGGLAEVVFSDNLKTIKDEAFHNCVGLTAIELPEGFLSTGGGVFQGCENLSEISLPDSLMRLGPLCFDQTAYYNDLDNWEDQLVLYLDDVVLQGRERWDEVAGEWDMALTGDYAIREGTRIVADEAFDFLDITSITFPATLEVIGEGAFYGCDGLTEVRIPGGVTHIYEIAFTSCDLLANVSLPGGLRHIGYDAFDNTAYLKSAQTTGTQILYNGGYVVGAFNSLSDAAIKEGTVLIAEEAFKNVASTLNTITLPESMQVIGADAFINAKKVTNVIVPKGVTFIGDHALGFVRSVNDADNYEYSRLSGFTITGYTGSAAEAYAHKFGIPFHALDGCAHDYTVTVTKPYTCFESGEHTYVCDLCGDSYTEAVPAQHTIVTDPAVEPGCNTPGWTEGSHCSVCGEVYVEQWEIGSLGHQVHSVDRINPECNAVGWTEGLWCETCQKYLVEPEEIPATGNHRIYSFSDEPATCYQEGRTGGTYCTFCQTVFEQPTIIPKTEHKYFLYPSTLTVATTTEEGLMARICMYCRGTTEEQVLPTVTAPVAESTRDGVKLTFAVYPNGVYYQVYREVVGGDGGSQMLGATFNTYYVDKTAQKGVTYRYTLKILDYNQNLMAVADAEDICYEFTTSHEYSGDCDRFCNICGEERGIDALHDYTDADCQTPMICRVCGDVFGGEGKHRYGEGVITTQPTCGNTGVMTYSCVVCDHVITETIPKLKDHDYAAATCTEAKTCKDCGTTSGSKLGHKYTNACDKKCNRCSYTRTIKHDYKAATCTKAKTCKACGATSGSKLGHSYEKKTTKATLTKNGVIKNVCERCDYVAGKTTTIYKASKVSLSKTTYTYDGKVKKPALTVKDSKGNTIAKSNYTVTYATGRKNVGKYKVTIKFKGNYTGTKTLYFKINPSKTTLSSLTAGSKKLTVKWTKKTTQVTGYQIQYSTSKSFSSVKTKTVTKNSTAGVSLTGLKAKTTYYVRVRTYKVVNGAKYYSGWSTIKYKKTK